MRKQAFESVYNTLEKGDNIRYNSDERFVKRLVYGTVERAIELDHIIDHFASKNIADMDDNLRTILRMGAYEIIYMDSVPESATCNEMCNLAKKVCEKYVPVVNGILRNIARADIEEVREEISKNIRDVVKKLSFLYSTPENLVKLLIDSYGKKTAKKIMASFYDDKQISLRAFTKNATVSKVRELFEANGIETIDSEYNPNMFLIKSQSVEKLPGFAEGYFTVQDESASLPVMVAGAKGRDCIVMDVCASPGGKTFQMADLVGPNGIVYAGDKTEEKVRLIESGIKRLGISNVKTAVRDALVDHPDQTEMADIVICDVPCSGIGVIGKKPEIKYHAVERCQELIEYQRQIVRSSVGVLKPGGTFIYSTCTINPAENEDNARWIEEEFGLEPVSLDEYLPEKLVNKMTGKGMLTMLPGIHRGDGFFVAKFRKV